MLGYILIAGFAFVEGEIYYSKVCATAIPIACGYADVRPLKYSLLSLMSGFAWAGAIMAFVAGGATTLEAFGLTSWWGPFIPAVLVILFFRWLSTPARHAP